MIVTYNWINEFVKIDLPVNELADKLTMMGLEVVGMKAVGIAEDIEGKVYLAKAKEVSKHPKAEKLSIVKAVTGRKSFNLVTNSPNLEKGDYVVVAEPGATFTNGVVISETEIKGEKSEGMMIPMEFLGLEEKSADIWILGKDPEHAKEIFDIYTQRDTVLEVDLTSNRSDCMSVVGIAREVAAMLDKTMIMPQAVIEEDDKIKMPDITIEDKTLCPRYTSRIIKGIKITQSPIDIQRKLSLCGMRPINNIVDATNYVMLEMGHPSHAFDLNRLEGEKVIVRKANKGEKLTTLDSTEIELSEDNLVIADEKNAVALAGVMGGENSEIIATTKNLLLECAFFDDVSIRRTAKQHGFRTESSHRFERTADWGITPKAVDRIIEVILKSSPGKVSVINDVYPNLIKDKVVGIKDGFVASRLGLNLSLNEVEDFLKRLEFPIMVKRDDLLEVKIPTWRSDISRPIDIVEEIARVYGYNNIPEPLFRPPVDVEGLAKGRDIKSNLRNIFRGIGYTEVYNHSFSNEEELSKYKMKDESLIELANPLTTDASILRNYLSLGLIRNVSYNVNNAYCNEVCVFEIGNVFKREQDGINEQMKLGLAHYGEGHDYQEMLGACEYLLRKLGMEHFDLKKANIEFLHPVNSAVLYYDKKKVGIIGEVHPDITDTMDVKHPIYIAELNLSVLEKLYRNPIALHPVTKFPPTGRDISLVVEDEVLARSIMNRITGAHEWIRKVEFVDLYKSDQVGKGKKSLTFSLLFQSGEGTLNDKEVNDVMDVIVKDLEETFQADLRA